jgi:hypothetical protein
MLGLAGATSAAAADMTPAVPGSTNGATSAPDAAPPTTTEPTTTEPSAAPPAAAPSGGSTPATAANASQAKALFDQLDANHDGMLSLEEFSRATFQQPK